jgi:tyrosine-protein kinase Etk/Wzc
MEDYSEHFFRDESIDLKKFLFKILFNWYWFVISLFIMVSVAYLINRYSEPIYRVNATIMIRDDARGKGLTGAENIIAGLEMFTSRMNVQNEMGILKSFALAHRALLELKDFDITYIKIGRRGIKEAKLYNMCPFYVELDTSRTNLRGKPVYITIISPEKYNLQINENNEVYKELSFGEPFEHENFHFTVRLRNSERFVLKTDASNKYYFYINNYNSLSNQYRNKLNINLNDTKGSILELAISGFVPLQEVDYLNKLCEVYIRSGLEEKNQIAVNSIEFIDSQLSEIADSLRKAEIQLLRFRLDNRIINISDEGQRIISHLTQLEADKKMLEIQKRYYEYLMDYLRKKTEYDAITAPAVMGIEDVLLNSLVNQLIEYSRQKLVLSYSVQDNIPSYELIIQQINNTRASILENAANNLNNLNVTENELIQQISDVENEILRLPVTERELINIQRRFTLSDNIYTYLLEKRAEAGIAKASNIADNKIIDFARLDNAAKIRPRSSFNYMIALLLGFLLPLIIIVVYEYFNNKILDRKDIEKYTKAPVLGAIGHNSYDSDIPAFDNPKSSIAESFRSLRTNLQYLESKKKEKVIAITSALSGEGKTFIAINLAAIIASSDKKVLLAGIDLRKPKIHKFFNIDNSKGGLSTFLIGKDKFEDIIHPTQIQNLFVASSGPVPPNPAELLGSPVMEDFFTIARNHYDYIIYDTPPVVVVTDALLLGKHADISIFLVRQNYSNKAILPLIDELYRKKEFNNLCILINDIRATGYYGYAYGYGYGYGYGYSYNYGYGQGYYEDDENGGYLNKLKRFIRRIRKA